MNGCECGCESVRVKGERRREHADPKIERQNEREKGEGVLKRT